MDSVDLNVLATAQAWMAEGRRVAWVTVARTWGSAPRPPGSWLVVRDDGAIEGSVSGGCIEDDLMDRMRSSQMQGNAPFTLTYGVTQEEARRVGLPCGGKLEVVVEPNPEPALLCDLAQRLSRRELVLKRIDLHTRSVSLSPAPQGATMQWDGHQLVTVHGPQWRLLIVGAGQISQYLARMALALDYDVTVCDPREEYHGDRAFPGIRLVRSMPDDALLAMGPDARCAVVALTHDPKLDDMVLLEALKSPAFYVGAVGSRLNNERRRERLVTHFELTADEIGRLHGPVGLPIGSHTPPEIAVAILAEMVAVRNGVLKPSFPQWPSRHGEAVCATA